MFDPFVQGESTLARAGGGLGLGLALVKGIAERHGGSVAVSSGVGGEGTEFRVRLPLAEPPAMAAHAKGRASPGRVARRVLVVDDNEDAAAALADLLTLFGHVVEVAHDGPTALAIARATRPDVVLCDIGLPGMTGYDVARALRGLGDGQMRLVALTGYAQPGDVAKVKAAGFDAHVAKPADPDELQRLIG